MQALTPQQALSTLVQHLIPEPDLISMAQAFARQEARKNTSKAEQIMMQIMQAPDYLPAGKFASRWKTTLEQKVLTSLRKFKPAFEKTICQKLNYCNKARAGLSDKDRGIILAIITQHLQGYNLPDRIIASYSWYFLEGGLLLEFCHCK